MKSNNIYNVVSTFDWRHQDHKMELSYCQGIKTAGQELSKTVTRWHSLFQNKSENTPFFDK